LSSKREGEGKKGGYAEGGNIYGGRQRRVGGGEVEIQKRKTKKKGVASDPRRPRMRKEKKPSRGKENIRSFFGRL